MRKLAGLTVLVVLVSVVPVAASENVFEFQTLVGIPTANLNIRNVPGGGLRWSVQKGEAKLSSSGVVRVEVEGLVFAEGPNTGINTVPNFVATLSCLNAAGSVVNVATTAVPATSSGDAKFEQQLSGIPSPCLAPVVFVGSPTRWFAISGF